MIVGIGVDLVDIGRFERTIERTPRLLERLFPAASERSLPRHSQAARYAAREALIKALGGSDGLFFHEVEIVTEPSGRPAFALSGSTAELIDRRGVTSMHLSLTHDGGFAVAYVVLEGADAGAPA